MGAEHPDRLAGLHDQRFVVFEIAQRSRDAVKALPVARGAADAAIDHELAGLLCHVRVEIVHQHTQRCLGQPALGRQLRAARRTDHARIVDAGHRGLLNEVVKLPGGQNPSRNSGWR